jgi:uncharacterized membrane protein YfcA
VTLAPAGYALLFGAAFVAGAVNSIAGGGSLLTFFSLILLGVSPLQANATSTVALLPGSLSSLWGFRAQLDRDHRLLLIVGLPSLIGGVLGALLLLGLGEARFSGLVPWLVLLATLLFIAQKPLRLLAARRAPAPVHAAPLRRRAQLALFCFQLLVSIYGGFFGSAMGILMLVAFGLCGVASIHQRNALKHMAAVCINGLAAIIFLWRGCVQLGPALCMMAAAIAGGYGGARLALRVGPIWVRRAIIVINLAIVAAAFWRSQR